MDTGSHHRKGPSCQWQTLSSRISNGIATFFYRLGFLVACHPWWTIFISWIIVGACGTGFLKFHTEKNPLKLWIPKESKFLHDTEWLMKSYEEGYRIQTVLISAPDVLQPEVLKKLLKINEGITQLTTLLPNGTYVNYSNVCFRIPYVAEYTKKEERRRKREDTDDVDFNFDDDFFNAIDEDTSDRIEKSVREFNPSVDLSPSLYCPLINALPLGCLFQNLLELWKFDANRIDSLTKDDILDALHRITVSPITGHQTDFTSLLGDIERNSTGHIVSASAIMSHWMVHVNFSDIDHEKTGNVAGTEDWASEETLLWENEYLLKLAELKNNLTDENVEITYMAGRSYGDISAATMFQDMDKLFIGGFLMFVFMQIVLSKYSWIEIRLMLGSMGLLSVGMAFISGCGICSFLGISYGPVHTSLPFLLMGLGVDDMFVMMACWRKIESKHIDGSIPERIGLMLRHAGASITVTSLTDIVAFLVGATTVLPSLQSFCLFAAISILMTFLFVVTFFVAIFTLDERRIEANRNFILPCIKHDESKKKLLCNKNLMQTSINAIYSKFFLTKPGKIIVIMTVACLTGISIESLMRLEQKFDPIWFIPERTYFSKFIQKRKEYFPDMGFEAGIFMGNLNYTAEFANIYDMTNLVENQTDILYKVNSWTVPFYEFVQTYYEKDLLVDSLSDNEWNTYLSKFLFSSNGGKYQANLRFNRKLTCGEPAPSINIASIEFRFRKFDNRNEYLPAMHKIEQIVANANLTTGSKFATVWGKIFANWITDEIIDEEVSRNIGLALLCVMFCTAILIVDLQICFWIFLCVLLTLINVCGFMQRWGLTIDLVSCIGLQLAVGLCVDYAAHIGHTFLTISSGTKNSRALETMLHIGSAVLYGGGSTLLALAMLAGSEAYTFQAFFKIFLLVIIFGMFHGIVFLPVMLSIIGPKPYHYQPSRNLSLNGDYPRQSKTNGIDEKGTELMHMEIGTTGADGIKTVKYLDEEKCPEETVRLKPT